MTGCAHSNRQSWAITFLKFRLARKLFAVACARDYLQHSQFTLAVVALRKEQKTEKLHLKKPYYLAFSLQSTIFIFFSSYYWI